MNKKTNYNPQQKENQLRAESESWDTTKIETAKSGDIPIIDLRSYFENPKETTLASLAEKLHHVSTKVGFFYVIGHDIPAELMTQTFAEIERFHSLPLVEKMKIQMDRADFSIGGVGYLPFQNRKLPTRKKGNANEAFIIKRQSGVKPVTLADNQWISESILPGFNHNIKAYAKAMEQLALKLLPVYSRALKVPANFFEEGFQSPMYRLRMTKYPSIKQYDTDEFGIAPHVDSTFITLLAQDKEGLVIYSEQRKCWINAPVVKDAFIVNTGELLRQWTNDYFISVKHFANNNTGEGVRYSIPFFFNATADYRMHCVPTCCSETNPSKYPPFSYLESQASVQGE